MDDIGQKLYQEYVEERINGNVSLWAPLKKQNNMMFTSANKALKIKARDNIIDLKETKNFYGRLMVLTKSNRDINQKDAIGTFEFTLTPRAFFNPDGSLLACKDKSKLIHLLENLIRDTNDLQTVESEVIDLHLEKKVAIVDGMVLVQKLSKKSSNIVTVRDLSLAFYEKLMQLTYNYNEIILVFDTYIQNSLKNKTRKDRLSGKDPVQYQIKDETNIKHILLGRFLSHEKTKSDLTEYLAAKTLEYSKNSLKLVITSACGITKSNRYIGDFVTNNHEEADTLMICFAVDTVRRSGVNAQLTVFSPDTDVLVLAIANYDLLPKNTTVSMASADLCIQAFWDVLGPDKAKALPALHAFSGSDTTGRFSQVAKPT